MQILYKILTNVLVISILSYIFFIAFIACVYWSRRKARLPLDRWQKITLLIIPIVIVTAFVGVVATYSPARKERYAQWKDKCGHEPIVIYYEWIGGYPRVRFNDMFVKDDGDEFYCTFKEAGKVPDDLTKESLIEGGYYPDEEDLKFINSERSKGPLAKPKIRF